MRIYDNHNKKQDRRSDVANLTDLIRVYDAANQLYHLSQQLSGPTLSQGSIVSELMRVADVIKRLSPLYEDGVDWEESRIQKELEDQGMSPEEKVSIAGVNRKHLAKSLGETERYQYQ